MWKIQLAVVNNFISSLNNDEERVMHSKIDKADEAIRELFDSLKNIYQSNLESMKGSEFVFMFSYCIVNFIK